MCLRFGTFLLTTADVGKPLFAGATLGRLEALLLVAVLSTLFSQLLTVVFHRTHRRNMANPLHQRRVCEPIDEAPPAKRFRGMVSRPAVVCFSLFSLCPRMRHAIINEPSANFRSRSYRFMCSATLRTN